MIETLRKQATEASEAVEFAEATARDKAKALTAHKAKVDAAAKAKAAIDARRQEEMLAAKLDDYRAEYDAATVAVEAAEAEADKVRAEADAVEAEVSKAISERCRVDFVLARALAETLTDGRAISQSDLADVLLERLQADLEALEADLSLYTTDGPKSGERKAIRTAIDELDYWLSELRGGGELVPLFYRDRDSWQAQFGAAKIVDERVKSYQNDWMSFVNSEYGRRAIKPDPDVDEFDWTGPNRRPVVR